MKESQLMHQVFPARAQAHSGLLWSVLIITSALLVHLAHAQVSFQGLGFLAGENYSVATSVSANGSIIVGDGLSGPFYWTPQSGMTGLDDLAESSLRAEAIGISANGSVIVGSAFQNDQRLPVRWVAGGAPEALGSLGGNGSRTFAVSSDGSVIAGFSQDSNGFTQAFRWTASSGMKGLGFLPGASTSFARGVSADGSVIVGSSSAINGEAFRWSADAGMIGLGFLPGDTFRACLQNQ